ncbi:type II toxin-antitoxin system VapB family antitoxin [Sphingomonas sp. NBWT7]|uniref:type II toxin-antitoxin system VapB family antitoxin n=1 Tax=Sphingomonas sp. NBWT7 TaxID=2596913 RepID=UPI00162ADFF4|nr:type II toxin-antitoxin system VapB family antitoxin [Sphingomonas sp. NBWT7]
MGVQLNIKDPETVRLARALADATGKSVTETIRAALESVQQQRLHLDRQKQDRVTAAIADVRRHLPTAWHSMTSAQVIDSVYGEDGSFAQ